MLQALHNLDRLIGTWKISGEADGTVTYEWMEGGHFLLQRVDVSQGGQRTRGLEVIGRERGFGAVEAGPEIKSRYYDNHGNTFDYVYEFDGDALTIWGGHRGSSNFYRGRLEGDTLSGRWTWPGGGYESSATRVPARRPHHA